MYAQTCGNSFATGGWVATWGFEVCARNMDV